MCLIVHILINKQLYKAFQRIETSVATHIDLEKEINKQVCNIHVFMAVVYFFVCCLGETYAFNFSS